MKHWIAACILALCLSYTHGIACSTFIATGSASVLVANNKDLRPSDQNAELFFIPGDKIRYGKMFWGGDHSLTQCGVNAAGLFIDVSPVPLVEGQLGASVDAAVPLASLLLDRCATVEEALILIRRRMDPRLQSTHVFVADKSGASVIVEWDGSKLHVLPKSGSYQIMTNFRLTDPQRGGHPCYRYNAILRMLRSEMHTPQLLRTALEHTHQEDLTYYSNIVDLSAGTITVFGCHNYGCPRTFNLAEELEKGEHSFSMETLFPKRRVDKDDLERRNGLIFEKGADAPFSGICVQKHTNGTVAKEGLVKHGIRAGRWKYYDESGACIDEDNFRRVLLFYDSGYLRTEGQLKNNMMIGSWKWLNEDRSVALEGEAHDGMFYRAGETLPYSGSLTVSYRNGSPCSERHFERGLLEGDALDWYDNGHLRSEGTFKNGRHAKRWKFYRRDGSLERIMNYEDFITPLHGP